MLGVLIVGIIYVGLVENYDWKSGWMPALFGLMVVIWVGAPRYRVLAVQGTLLVILVNFTSVSALLTGQEEYSLSTRTEAWRIVFEIAKVNPITGLGFANYYWYTPLYAIMGYRVSFNSHNNYLDLLAQTGILGLGAFLWFAASIGILGWKLVKQVPEGFHKAYIIGALGGLVGTLAAGMLGDWFLPFVYNVGLVGFRSSVFAWLFLGGLVVYEQLARQARIGVKDATA
jgi:O-antigen ligase